MAVVDLTCPNCLATMKIDLKNGTATCEYCGKIMLLLNDNEVPEYFDTVEILQEFLDGIRIEKSENEAPYEYWKPAPPSENEPLDPDALRRLEAERQSRLQALRDEEDEEKDISGYFGNKPDEQTPFYYAENAASRFLDEDLSEEERRRKINLFMEMEKENKNLQVGRYYTSGPGAEDEGFLQKMRAGYDFLSSNWPVVMVVIGLILIVLCMMAVCVIGMR